VAVIDSGDANESAWTQESASAPQVCLPSMLLAPAINRGSDTN
jgi:hypothetical protein